MAGGKSKAEVKPRARRRAKRSREGHPHTDLGKRGAVIALKTAGHKYHEIARIIGVPIQTASDIYKHAIQNAQENKENHDPTPDPNLNPVTNRGRPQKFNSEQRQAMVQLATRDGSQRRKPFTHLARECPFKISTS
ncbi:uncharacterized protein LAJ45_01098 [Morchella importuna]|uniref:uncharacterized protein n=1 Tax=Morchella importuna TaxID=1174673 RepID=UPI001E8ED47F|nr:uncharacterized protein LAJ45_01098 [Morchella importuna]KAH8154570.1 hypothetical protein LAJ45_01098 [Morchella importuna]